MQVRKNAGRTKDWKGAYKKEAIRIAGQIIQKEHKMNKMRLGNKITEDTITLSVLVHSVLMSILQ